MPGAPPPLELDVADLEATRRIAHAVGRRCAAGDAVVLSGTLAAGKTQFVQFLGEALEIEDAIVSPTFTLANLYAGAGLPLCHVDVYRLQSANEFSDLSLEEIMETHVTAIEWGETVAERLPSHLAVRIVARPDGTRRIALTASGPAWRARMPELARDLKALEAQC